jgi:sporulation protein YlmC with PRC-barrel domain
MNRRLAIIILAGSLAVLPLHAAADCAARIDELRALQARTPLLDPQRPDLERLRGVAQDLAERGKEALCLDLVEELESLVNEHRAHARNVQDLEKYAAPVPIESRPDLLDSSSLTGMPVRNRLGKELGVVRGLRLVPQEGRVDAITVEHGGFLGLGERRVAVPWEMIRLAQDGSALVVDMTEEEMGQQGEVK